MKLVAINTIHGQKTIRPRDVKIPNDRGEYREVIVTPGSPFDSADLSMSEDEAKDLIASGAARLHTREVPVDSPKDAPKDAPKDGPKEADKDAAKESDKK